MMHRKQPNTDVNDQGNQSEQDMFNDTSDDDMISCGQPEPKQTSSPQKSPSAQPKSPQMTQNNHGHKQYHAIDGRLIGLV